MNSTASATGMPLWKKLLIGLAALLCLLVVAGLITIRVSGAWNLLFPSHQHETVAPELPALTGPALLVFTKTNSFRHIEGIDAGLELVQKIAAKRGWSLFHTENGAVFNSAHLSRFAAVVFLNASGDVLDTAQEQAFQRWLEAGGGWLGVHAAGDDSHAEWSWYTEQLIGAHFSGHIMGPQFQSAKVEVENPGHAAMAGLPDSWMHKEEWYSWHSSPREKGFNILATLDESSYSPWMNYLGSELDLRMGDHPVVWSRCVGKGRAIYSTMGHSAAAFEAPEHRLLLENALAWVLGKSGQLCTAR